MNFILKWILLIVVIILAYLLIQHYVYPKVCSYYYGGAGDGDDDCCEDDDNDYCYPPGHPNYKAASTRSSSKASSDDVSWTSKVKTSMGLSDGAIDEAAEFVADSTPGYYGWLAKIGLILKRGGGRRTEELEDDDDDDGGVGCNKNVKNIESDFTDHNNKQGGVFFDYKDKTSKTMKKRVEKYKRESMRETESAFVRSVALESIRDLLVKHGANVNKNYRENAILDVGNSEYVFVDAVIVGSGNSFGLKFRGFCSSEFPNPKHKSLEEFEYYRNVELKEVEDSINAGLYLIEIPWNVYMVEPTEDEATGEVKWRVNSESPFNQTVRKTPEQHREFIVDKFLQYVQHHLSLGYQEFLADTCRNPYPKFFC